MIAQIRRKSNRLEQLELPADVGRELRQTLLGLLESSPTPAYERDILGRNVVVSPIYGDYSLGAPLAWSIAIEGSPTRAVAIVPASALALIDAVFIAPNRKPLRLDASTDAAKALRRFVADHLAGVDEPCVVKGGAR